jgi:hypothetical protein
MDTTALEVKRVQSSADLLHPGESVFVAKRAPIITVEKHPIDPPQGKFKLLWWTFFGKKHELKQIVELWVVKTSHIHKFNNLATEPFSSHQRTSSSKTLPCVSNCWLSTPNNLGADSLPYTSCSGSDCEDSGRNGRSLSSWLHPEPLSAGMAPAFGCIGNGSPELDRPEAEKLSAKRFGR